jgi:CPA2 family monovalent cation:H+ antiporter-2
MAELGLVFLLFSLGLEFNLPKIRKVGLSAGMAAVLEVIGMLAIGYGLGRAFGWTKTDSIFLGAILSISSTTIIVKVFMDFKMMQEKFVQVVFGILVLEDIVAVAILSILSGLGTQGGPDTSAILISFLHIGLFVTLFLVLGLLLIPRFIHWVAGFKSKEVLGVVTLGMCLGGSMLALWANLSVALGAFLSGAVMAASQEIEEIEEWIHPVRDMFSAIFFVSAGMLIQPQLLWEYRVPITVVTVVTLVGKVLSGAVGSFLAGYDMKTSTRVGMSLAQIGEFSFVIASLGLSLKVTSDFLYPLAVTVSSLTTLATPYLIRNSDRVVESLTGLLPASVRTTLENYKPFTGHSAGHGTAIFSKYLIRLGVYIALFVGVLTLLNGISLVIPAGPFMVAFWAVSAATCLPLFSAISKFANHIILLLVTRNKTILHHINIHTFYNTLNAISTTVLMMVVIYSASTFIPQGLVLLIMAAWLALAAGIFKRQINNGKERLEGFLDQVTGLATSEPTRQAVIKSGDGALLLAAITEQISLPENSPSRGRSIRETRLREETGATVVAIYREGTHIANPGPDTTLQSDDILILLGNQTELDKARRFLLSSAS